jgi:exopolyphosphatase/guanosine-5'-triphosphate,3'-diphosphate pyrophosphatase
LVAIDAALEPYDGARVHGASLTRQQVAQCIERLAPLTPAERATIPGLDAKRADVILAGALIVREILDALGAPGLVASDRGVRWGLAEEALSA